MNSITESNCHLRIPMSVVSDERISHLDKLVFGSIILLSRQLGYCYANNRYFAKSHNVSTRTISRSLQSLVQNDYIKIEYENINTNNTKRKIFLKNEKVWTETSGGIVKIDTQEKDKSVIQNKEQYKNIKWNSATKVIAPVPDWLNKEIETVPPTPEELSEMKEILAQYK